ncbi:pilus assembly protein PilX [Pseudoduganella sp. FT93W]|uniref:Pilus assembly protein PilX n=1 Tax=Duganella fentianensis TaxID=2692177 RepID=A0A845HUA0_9BURK|nr:pilus assembly protein [Duganella fentianensis]MYN45024.1 pilus assembly protein PilX [Duganella fentianensis]
MRGRTQRGMAVLLSLVLLVIVLLLGTSAAQLSLQGTRSARAARDRDVAFQAAEAAVADAEHDLENGTAVLTPCVQTPAWQKVDVSGREDDGACSVEYGARTGASFDAADGALPFKRPRYLIERLVCHQPGDDAAAGAAPHYCYRVTAIGFGPQPDTEVVLQTIYSRGE